MPYHRRGIVVLSLEWLFLLFAGKLFASSSYTVHRKATEPGPPPSCWHTEIRRSICFWCGFSSLFPFCAGGQVQYVQPHCTAMPWRPQNSNWKMCNPATLTRNSPPLPSSSSSTYPCTNEWLGACHATVTELFSAEQSSGMMTGARGTVEATTTTTTERTLANARCWVGRWGGKDELFKLLSISKVSRLARHSRYGESTHERASESSVPGQKLNGKTVRIEAEWNGKK